MDASNSGPSVDIIQPPFPVLVTRSISRRYAQFLDQSVPHTAPRWFFIAFLILLFIWRIWYCSTYYNTGFEIICYGLFIYALNLFIGFLSPQDGIPDTTGQTDGGELDGGEYRPFRRKLPEFKCWKSLLHSIFFSFFCTFFPFLSIPVFWPILVIYALILFFLTMKRRVLHMIRHKYIPFSWGKKTYGKRENVDIIKKKLPNAIPSVRAAIRSLPKHLKPVAKANRD